MSTQTCFLNPGSLTSCEGLSKDTWPMGDVWVYSVIATILVSLCGVIPIVFIPLDGIKSLNTPAGASKLRKYLAFAVGSLLGDVFLHLLPESWRKSAATNSHTWCGLMVVFGVLSFSLVEKIAESKEQDEEEDASKLDKTYDIVNGDSGDHGDKDERVRLPKVQKSWVTGYLNLLANCFDNFSHGLAIGGSFLTSYKVGMITTFAILIHEIPHEIGDFAILVRSGFSRKGAAKAQFLTAAGGLLGASTALWCESPADVEHKTSWILPFAAGGFLNIALVNLLPELLQERNILESVKQLIFLSAGVLVMAAVTMLFEA